MYIFSDLGDKKTEVSYYDFNTKSLVKTGLTYIGTRINGISSSRYYAIIMKNNNIYYIDDEY